MFSLLDNGIHEFFFFETRIFWNILKSIGFTDFLEASLTLTKEDKDVTKYNSDILHAHALSYGVFVPKYLSIEILK